MLPKQLAREHDNATASGVEVSAPGVQVLPKLFIAFFVQLFLLVVVSFIAQAGPVFVLRYFFGLDYYDFYVAATDWMHHVDPYLRGRLYTPPSSILLGLSLNWMSFPHARLVVMGANLVLVYCSLRALARHFALGRSNEIALLGITCTFYPFYFLIERGNLDGIMLALLVFGFVSKRWLARAVLIGASVAIKVYSGLLFGVMLLRKRNWKTVIAGTVVCALMQVPFLHLLPKFVSAVAGRSGMFRIDENISPAALIWVLFGGMGPWKLIFAVLWGGTLLWRLRRDRDADIAHIWPVYVPWMISLPTMVYPYSGVLALALVAMIAAACQQRRPTDAEKAVLLGFGFLGFQAVAWSYYLYPIWHGAPMLHVIGAIGNLFMMIGACGLPSYGQALEASGRLHSDSRNAAAIHESTAAETSTR